MKISLLFPAWLWTCLVSCALLLPGPAARAEKHVLLIAGPPSHGWGEHEHPDGCRLLADCLNQANLDLQAEVSLGWPSNELAVTEADTLVLYGDGLDTHVARDHVDALTRHRDQGKGLVVLHFALEPAPGPLADFLLETLGGRFEPDWSVNPKWSLTHPTLLPHPVSHGVETFSVDDEFYFHLRFAEDIQAILQAAPPLDALGDDGPRSGNPALRAELAEGRPQVLAWVSERTGARAFGFTGGHYHFNWSNPDYRKLVLNAVAWTAGIEIPAAGIDSTTPPLTRYESIDEGIARGDIDEVRRQLAAHPERLNQGRNPSLNPLHQAILRRKAEIALLLLAAGADPNQADGSRRTPIHLAVERNSPALITALLAEQANPNLLDQTGWAPLHHAAANNRLECVRALLVGGADPQVRSERGGTPLHEAAASGSPELIQLLLAHGVDPNTASFTGVTALDIARQATNQPAIELLSGEDGPAP